MTDLKIDESLRIKEKLKYLESLRAKTGLRPITFIIDSERVIDKLILYFENQN